MEISPGALAQSQQLFLAQFGKLVNLNDPVALSLSVKMLSNHQCKGDQREQFQFVLRILF